MVIKHFQGEYMKLAKLSLAAIVVAGLASSSFAADTLADAFKNGKVNQHLNSLEIKIDKTKQHRKGDAPFFNVSFVTNRSVIQTFNTIVIKLKTNSNNETNSN